MKIVYSLLAGCGLALLAGVCVLVLPNPVSAAACTGSCVAGSAACPSAFPIETAGNTCPTAGQKCCEKDSLSSGGAGAPSKTCAQAPGGGICVAKDQQCPTGKTDVDATYPCVSLGQKCCGGVAAGSASPGSPIKLNDPLGGVGLYGLVRRVINTALGLVGAITLLVFFASGVMYMAGGEAYVSTAKAAMVNAVIGLAVIFFAYSIANFFFMALTTNAT